MVDEIEDRRLKGENRSQYMRGALQARFNAEDAGEWIDPEIEPPDATPADAD